MKKILVVAATMLSVAAFVKPAAAAAEQPTLGTHPIVRGIPAPGARGVIFQRPQRPIFGRVIYRPSPVIGRVIFQPNRVVGVRPVLTKGVPVFRPGL